MRGIKQGKNEIEDLLKRKKDRLAMVSVTSDYGRLQTRSLIDGFRKFNKANTESGNGIVKLDAAKLKFCLWMLFAIVMAIGVCREIVVSMIGTETMLKDLRHFQFDAERSIPSWYENLALATAAGLLAIVAMQSRMNDRANRMAWTLLSVIFFLMSIDGAVSFHEISVKPLRNAFSLSGIFYYSWVVLAIPIVAAVGLYFLPFLFRLPKHVAIGFIASGSLFVGGALGTEFLCGYLATSSGLDSVAYKIAAASEEALEATGITLFISILIGHLAKNDLKLYMNSQY